ncbi:protein-tyrosine phosphatase family protein [Saccharibacillus deserti]|uniref:protein-tyrosine phosphatase family protein n=1 Tax=Saccharibacillus deserti TaxID=1634444 RepID=UPI0015554F7E|nr:dual specificity protein phosphatase family protein [Saccharibacillus deserti]
MTKSYHQLIAPNIYMGGAADVEQMITEEHCEVIVDLREEATEIAYQSPDRQVEWIRIALDDHARTTQEDVFKQAIDQVVASSQQGKKIGFHCGGGKGRTGAVAIGTLLAVGKASTLAEAERMAKDIRPVISIKDTQREALECIFPNA